MQNQVSPRSPAQGKFVSVSLGTDNPKLTTESSHNYKLHNLNLDSPSCNTKDTKTSHFIFGSNIQNYSTTASASYEFPLTCHVEPSVKSKTKNIHFGNEKVKKISIVQSDFTVKTPNKLTQLESSLIKASQDNCHFSFGSFQDEYKSTNRDYRAFSSTPNRKSENFNNNVSVVLGNFRTKNKTENQEKFVRTQGKSESRDLNKSFYMKKANFMLGSFLDVPVATSKETYKGEQIEVRETIQGLPAKANNVILGKDSHKWQSSYRKSFEEKEINDYKKVTSSKKTNFNLGFHHVPTSTLAQESYNVKNPDVNSKVVRPQMVYLGGFKTQFRTGNSIYGSSLINNT